jgi:hypothetical protein
MVVVSSCFAVDTGMQSAHVGTTTGPCGVMIGDQVTAAGTTALFTLIASVSTATLQRAAHRKQQQIDCACCGTIGAIRRVLLI